MYVRHLRVTPDERTAREVMSLHGDSASVIVLCECERSAAVPEAYL